MRKRQVCICGLVMALMACGVAVAQSAGSDTDDKNNLDSPRAAMFTFLAGVNAALDPQSNLETRTAGWEQAVKCLDLSRVDTTRAHELAEDLLAVLNQIGEVTADELPDAKGVAAMGITRYRYFPRSSSEVHEQIVGRLAASGKTLGGQIILVETRPGRWQFSSKTVAQIDVLYAAMRGLPRRYTGTGAGQVLTLLGPTFEQTPVWGWGVLLGGIFLGLLAGKMSQYSLRGVGRRFQSKGWSVRATVFEDAASPVSLALLGLGLGLGLSVVSMEAPLRGFANNVVALLFTIAAGWFLFNLVDVIDLAMRRLAAKTESKLDDQVVPLVRKTLRIFLVIVLTLFVAQNIFGLNITGWLAGLGIAGLAVSLAAQDSVKNLFGSLTVFFDKPFVVGDYISFDGNTGTVEEIGFRSAKIRLLSGHVVTVPNMKFIDNAVENISARPYIRRQMDVTITYDTPPDKIEQAVAIVREVLTDVQVVEQGRFDLESKPPRVAFNELNAESLNIRAYYWYQMAGDSDRGFFTYLDHCQLVNMKLFRAYERAGIEFAFPTQTIHLVQ